MNRNLRGICRRAFGLDTLPSLDQTKVVEPFHKPDPNAPSASTDVGDVSWVVPTIGFTTATFVPGSVAHSVAGCGNRGNEHRAGWDGGGVEGVGGYGCGFVYEAGVDRCGQGGFCEGACREDVSVGDPGGAEAADRLPGEVGLSEESVKVRVGSYTHGTDFKAGTLRWRSVPFAILRCSDF